MPDGSNDCELEPDLEPGLREVAITQSVKPASAHMWPRDDGFMLLEHGIVERASAILGKVQRQRVDASCWTLETRSSHERLDDGGPKRFFVSVGSGERTHAPAIHDLTLSGCNGETSRRG